MAENPSTENAGLLVDAYPTREFFVSMIVKDVGLIPAIIDLVDNCLDGAKRVRRADDYKGLWVRLTFSGEYFQILDNCGGITVETAKSYAFCFGRPQGGKLTRGSVGRFGIGMKRTLFKMGREFEVESRTATSEFRVQVDVDEWLAQEGEWRFSFASPPREGIRVAPACQGTKIRVTRLHDTVSDELGIETFSEALATQIESKHSQSLARGLRIAVNGRELKAHPMQLRSSPRLRPAVRTLMRTSLKPNDVKIRMLVGLGASDPRRAGWYVFCNGRMIIEADQTWTTGWGVHGSTPRFHNQYAEFRGYVFMESDDALGLPWNTMKTNVDTNSPVFKSLRSEMIQLLEPVVTFLNRMKEEKDRRRKEGKGPGPIETAVTSAQFRSLSSLKREQQLRFPPQPAPKAKPKMANIAYAVSPEELRKAKESLRAGSNAEVGRMTFEYYMEMECER